MKNNQPLRKSPFGRFRGLIFLAFVFLFSCKGSKDATNTTDANTAATMVTSEITYSPALKGERVKKSGPDAVVYKTVKDYSDFVPVIMNQERTQIVSYPAPSDVYYKGELAKPTLLKNGYLLDNRGINENVAFTSYTYEAYSKLSEAPSMDILLSKIVDKYPLSEIVNCGLRSQYTDEVNDLNNLIDNDFAGYKKTEAPPLIHILE